MLSLLKNLHKKYKEIEPYNLLLGIFGIVGGGFASIWAGFKALASPIVDVLGNTLSFIVGTTLAIILTIVLAKAFIFFKEFFYKGYYFTKRDIERINRSRYEDGAFFNNWKIMESSLNYNIANDYNKIQKLCLSVPNNSTVGLEVELKNILDRNKYKLTFFDKYGNEKVATLPNSDIELKTKDSEIFFKLEQLGYMSEEVNLNIYSKYWKYDKLSKNK